MKLEVIIEKDETGYYVQLPLSALQTSMPIL